VSVGTHFMLSSAALWGVSSLTWPCGIFARPFFAIRRKQIAHVNRTIFDLSCGPTLEPMVVLQPLRSCEGVSQPGCPWAGGERTQPYQRGDRVQASASRACEMALQRRAGELVKVRALIRFPVDGNAVELRGILGSEAVRNDFDRTPFKL